MSRPANQQSVLNILENLNGLDPLKELFWNELNYERINEPISRRGWTEPAAKALADDPLVFAGGGDNDSFKIILSRLDSEKVPLGMQRPVVNRLIRDFPYALFVFSNRDQDRWHFVNVKYDEDASRRRLFRRISVTPGDRLRTASERIALLDLEGAGAYAPPLTIQDRHDEAFDVEAVTKKFFEDFCKVFEHVAKDIRKHNDWDNDIVEKETQTLLNRLLFLYFIQRKGWLNRERDYLFKRFKEQFREEADGFTYYSRFVHPLFMRLSTEMEKPASFLGDVPFLNGGLFDDEYGGQQRQDKLLRRTRMKVSNRVFKRVFDDVLEKYNFTVREDTPLNQDVSIDPEMLGKIFESLVLQLEQPDTGRKTSRHDTGSYYTPRPIVHYLCREALRVCLESKDEDRHKNVAKLLAIDASDGIDADERAIFDECLSPEQAKVLRDDLDNLRACDPAVGSGAFPLGLLHELVNLSRLCEARSRGRDPVEVDVDWLYNTKSRFIERVIYGVDIQERGVEICKLRLWLSLMVDLDIGVDVDDCSASAFRTALRPKVAPLPNLDYKIRRADSLIDQIHGEPVHVEAHADPRFHVILSRLNEAKQEFYRAKKLEAKRRWRFRIFDATAELGQHEIAWERNRIGELIADEKHGARIAELDRAMRELGNMREQIKAANRLKAHQQDDALERFNKRFDDPEKPTFVWQLDFAEVFHRNGSQRLRGNDFLSENEDQTGTSGFDIIVANPPYVRMEMFKTIKAELRLQYPNVHSERADLYCYFYARGLQLLAPGGVLSFISSNKFFRAGYGQPLREFLTKCTEIQIAIDFGDLPIFEATTYPAIVVTRNSKPGKNHKICTLNVRTEDELARFTESELTPLPQTDFGWRLEDLTTLGLLRKLRSAGPPLRDYAQRKIYRGIVTGLNEAFIIDSSKRNKLLATSPKATEVIKPYVAGRNVRRWVCEDSGKWLLYLPHGVSTKGLDAVLDHLRPFRRELESRATEQNWYELQQPQEKFLTAYQRPKIIFPDIASTLRFALDTKGTFFTNTAYCISSEDLYLIAVLNSSVVQYLYFYLSAQIRGGYVRLFTQYVEQIPIPIGTDKDRATISRLAKKCLDSASEGVADVETEINERVARLYGLTRDEMRIVEEGTR